VTPPSTSPSASAAADDATAAGDAAPDDRRPDARIQVTGGGEPSPQEMAAIVTALLVTRSRAAGRAVIEPPPRWRFSGRWWSKPIPLRRVRPR
jgi:hypothetical protein